MKYHIEMKYQIGGSLRSNDPTYVVRQADEQMYHALKAGKFCYVLNARQMGKSSLLQRTSDRLQKEGFACVYLDMTQLRSEAVSSRQWYRGIIAMLYYGLNLTQHVNLLDWWTQQQQSPVQQLHQFIENIVLPHIQAKRLFIFIDEIDSLLSLKFPIGDFFAWIHSCYRQRACNSTFKRLDFAVFGVATFSDLITDRCQTPFQTGTAIELHDFQLHEATPLLRQLKSHVHGAEAILREIFHWTQGQPFLTQKLCQLVLQAAWDKSAKPVSLSSNPEALWVEALVQFHVIQQWELQDDPEHFRTIRDRLLFDKRHTMQLLKLYQQLVAAEYSPSLRVAALDSSPEQEKLLLTGLVAKRCGYLRIKNPIYRSVFDAEWIGKQLEYINAGTQRKLINK
jgi:hypothetical protein